ncbi:MAG: hypothetical protein HY982_02695 [Candidatus Magasanikbacteria bacterium]|nr:hypothetical protein [Candidatus Magasanikbacteria bacterium]
MKKIVVTLILIAAIAIVGFLILNTKKTETITIKEPFKLNNEVKTSVRVIQPGEK